MRSADAYDRRLQIAEALYCDLGRDLGANAADLPGFMGSDGAAGLLDGGQDRLQVERRKCARIDDFDVDAFPSQLARGSERLMHVPTSGDDGRVLALAHDARLTY